MHACMTDTQTQTKRQARTLQSEPCTVTTTPVRSMYSPDTTFTSIFSTHQFAVGAECRGI